MAHGIEARLPFLDYRLVSFLFGLADNYKMRGPRNKYVLRQSMKERIPESVRVRKEKMGFPTSAGRWLAGPLYETARDPINDKETRERGIYDTARILKDLQRHKKREIDISGRLLNLLQFELWLRTVAGDHRSPRQMQSP